MVIEDLAVEDDDVPAVMRGHGLVAAFGQVDDREAAVAKADITAVGKPQAIVVGAAVRDGIAHRGNGRPIDRLARRQVTYNSTHQFSVASLTTMRSAMTWPRA